MKQRLFALWDAWISRDAGWINTRLMSMIGMIVSSIVVLVFTYKNTLTADIFLIFLAYAGGSASYFKHVDNRTAVKELEIEKNAEVRKEEINAQVAAPVQE
jgi:hypothetical protein